MDTQLKIGDKIIDRFGRIGWVKGLCDCDDCKQLEHGYPIIEPLNPDHHMNVTRHDKENGFRDFLKIGDRYFPEHVDIDAITAVVRSKEMVLDLARTEIDELHWVMLKTARYNFSKEMLEKKWIDCLFKILTRTGRRLIRVLRTLSQTRKSICEDWRENECQK